jgi:diguanylate cyclase (GGDEF)-like protein/PAS domain S-box-containing protein
LVVSLRLHITGSFEVSMATRDDPPAELLGMCQILFDCYPSGAVAVFDADLRFVYVGGAVLPLIGLSADGMRGSSVGETFPSAVVEAVTPAYLHALQGKSDSVEVDFGGRRFLARTAPVDAPDGRRFGLVTVEDVTSFRETEEQLSLAVETFRTAFDSAPIGMALVGLDGLFLQVNSALCDILGYEAPALQNLTFQDITHPDDLHIDIAQAEQLVRGEIPRYQMEKRYYDHRGHVVWAQLSGSLVRDADGEPVHFIAQIEDISERKRREEELTRMARRDPLTGLLNRSVFDADLGVYRRAAGRYGDTTGLVLIDLDGFKVVNDLGGHEVGDNVLAEVAKAIRSRTRLTDHAYRIGGDEFAVLVPHTTGESALPLVNSLREVIESVTIHGDDRSFSVGASIGVATIAPGATENPLRDADEALYRDKAARRP